MLITRLASNVGRSGGNRSLLFSLFCRVGLFFVLECLVGRDGMVLAHEEHDIELLSFIVGSGVAVYARKTYVGLFEVCKHTSYAGIVSIGREGGVVLKVAGVYVPPRVSGLTMKEIVGGFGDVDLMVGDFNARHPHWSGGLDERIYPSGTALLEIVREGGLEVCLANELTYRDVSVIDITIHRIPGHFTH